VLSNIGLFIVMGYTAFSAIKLRRKLKIMKIPEAQKKISFM
jgi:hypothetical protein